MEDTMSSQVETLWNMALVLGAVVLVADADDPARAETLAARLIAAVQAPIPFGKRRLKVGLSVGIAQAPSHGFDSETLSNASFT